MAAEAIPVTVEWALWGKEPTSLEYSVLAHSEGGSLDSRMSRELLSRYVSVPIPDRQSGEPQVAVFGFQDSAGRHVAMTISEASPSTVDDRGRSITFTRLYIVPFEQLASGLEPVTYMTMFETLLKFQLRDGNRELIRTEFATTPPSPAPLGKAAIRAAALIAAGKRVCATGTPSDLLRDRLSLIDEIVSLLPYGFRWKFSAATQTIAYQRSRLRLYFGYDREEPDVAVVSWPDGETESVINSPADQEAAELADELARNPAAAAFAFALMREDLPGTNPAAGMLATLSDPRFLAKRFIEALAKKHPQSWAADAVSAAARQGLLAHRLPAEMRQGKAESVEVRIARPGVLHDALEQGLEGRGLTRIRPIPTAPLMTVHLMSGMSDGKEAFDIRPYGEPEQIVDDVAQWHFDVLPVRSGPQTIVLAVYLRVVIEGIDAASTGSKTVEVMRQDIQVQVDVVYRTRHFVVDNWKLLTTTAAGGGGVAAWIELFRH
jgi:hypothetical protein